MSRFILIALILAGIVLWWYWQNTSEPELKKKLLQKTIIAGLLVVTLLLVVTGRMHWLAIVLAGLLAFLKQGLGLLVRYFPVLIQLYRKYASTNRTQNKADTDNRPIISSAKMTVDEALQVLGLAGSPTKEDITRAYRKLMQQLHPDRGGNEYLATKANQARDILIDKFG